MNKEEVVLDALAWAGISEAARIARIANKLVRGLNRYNTTVTKTAIAEAVRETVPPYGRGKAICEGVGKAIERQRPIHTKRRDEQEEWQNYIDHLANRSVRINHGYAARFGRPPHTPVRHYTGYYGSESYWEKQQAHQKAESERDKGDDCIGLLIYQETYTVALLQSADKLPGAYYIAVRSRLGGEPHYTPLRTRCSNFVEAVVALGGPKVRSALAQGLQVHTDWVGRRTIITRPNGKTEELPWLTERFHQREGYRGHDSESIVVLGDVVVAVEKDQAQ